MRRWAVKIGGGYWGGVTNDWKLISSAGDAILFGTYKGARQAANDLDAILDVPRVRVVRWDITEKEVA